MPRACGLHVWGERDAMFSTLAVLRASVRPPDRDMPFRAALAQRAALRLLRRREVLMKLRRLTGSPLRPGTYHTLSNETGVVHHSKIGCRLAAMGQNENPPF